MLCVFMMFSHFSTSFIGIYYKYQIMIHGEKTHVVFVQSQMMRGQHSDSQARAQRRVQKAAQDRLVL